MYFNYSSHGYCVEEAFNAFVPQYLVNAAAILNKHERKKYLETNIYQQFDDYEHYVRTHICSLVKFIEGFYGDNPTFSRWVFVVAKKHEYRLQKEYFAALNDVIDRKLIVSDYLKEISSQLSSFYVKADESPVLLGALFLGATYV